jgi:hypothetical protein
MKTIKPVIFAGANAGGTAAAGILADANGRAHDTEFTLDVIDPNGENLSRFAAFAASRSLTITTQQQPIEVALAGRTDDAPLGIFIDNPASIAASLEEGARTKRPMLLYVAILLSTGDLLGLRAVFTSAQAALALQLALFFRAVSGATVRSGASAVFGSDAAPRSVGLEPLIRGWFSAHLVSNVYKLLYNLPPVSAPIEVTRDGTKALPLIFHDSPTGWDEPQALAERVLARPPMPLELGADLMIAEIGPDNDVRLHEARRRRSDRQIALRNASVPTVVDTGWPSLVTAVRRVEQNTISPGFPIYTTD